MRNGRIQKYGQCDYPSGAAEDGGGNVYVADAGNHRIQKCGCPPVDSASGAFLD
jgi:hypothetical protein